MIVLSFGSGPGQENLTEPVLRRDHAQLLEGWAQRGTGDSRIREPTSTLGSYSLTAGVGPYESYRQIARSGCRQRLEFPL